MTRYSARQLDILRAIHRFHTLNGYMPTLRELGELTGITSTNGVNDHLDALERKGALSRGPQNKARVMRITLAGQQLLD